LTGGRPRRVPLSRSCRGQSALGLLGQRIAEAVDLELLVDVPRWVCVSRHALHLVRASFVAPARNARWPTTPRALWAITRACDQAAFYGPGCNACDCSIGLAVAPVPLVDRDLPAGSRGDRGRFRGQWGAARRVGVGSGGPLPGVNATRRTWLRSVARRYGSVGSSRPSGYALFCFWVRIQCRVPPRPTTPTKPRLRLGFVIGRPGPSAAHHSASGGQLPARGGIRRTRSATVGSPG
jgi:hypothetical protein